MGISFNEIPDTLRIPFSYTEIDGSQAVRGVQPDAQKALIIGQKLASGTATVERLVQVRSEGEARVLFGAGSLLHMMCKFYLLNNKWTEMWAIPLNDASAGAKAAGKFTFTGPASAAGSVCVYIGGVRAAAAVASGDTATAIATAITAAINANADLPVDATASSGEVALSFKHKGTVGNSLDLRINYNGESLPTGVACTITAMSSGTTDPDIQDAIDVFGDETWDAIIHPYSDTSNLTALRTELDARWAATNQRSGHAYGAVDKSYADLASFGNALNSKQLTFVGITKCPTPTWCISAAIGGIVTFYSPIDPARPLQTLVLQGVLPPDKSDQLDDAERNLLLYDGISTLKINAGGDVQIERLITTYKTNSNGVADPAFLDVEPKLTLTRLRKEHNANILRVFPRHKVANDGTRFAPGQQILTPSIFAAFVLGEFSDWESRGWVEGFEQFKAELIVERNSSDPCRLDTLMKPDLVNQLRVFGTKIAFYL